MKKAKFWFRNFFILLIFFIFCGILDQFYRNISSGEKFGLNNAVLIDTAIERPKNNEIETKELKKRVFLMPRHSGLIKEMVQVFEQNDIYYHLGLDQSVEIIKKYGNSINQSLADQLINTPFYKSSCEIYDLIIISDALSIGRPFLQASPYKCKAKLLLQLTNRFDSGLSQDKTFADLIKSLIDNKKVFWQPSNDYDMLYLSMKEIYPKNERLFLIKPVGYSNEPEEEIVIEEPKYVIYSRCFSFVEKMLDNYNVSKTKYDLVQQQSYSGPRTLAKQKMFVYFPCEFSSVKVFENMYAGVLMAIPTREFFKEIVLDVYQKPDEPSQPFRSYFMIKDMFNKHPNDWAEYYDIYHKSYKHMFVKFSGWEELSWLLNEDIIVEKDYYVNTMRSVMERHEKESIMKYKQMFAKIWED
jgi:hypothetical protein